jgi:flagellar hook-associated protein 3 FlgL
VRATDDALRDFLKPLAMAALASDSGLGLSAQVQMEVLSAAGVALIDGQKPFVELRASLGALEARIEESITRNASERSATSMAKLELIQADTFETASRYEEVRSQLESLYAITARSQRLSLAEFL